MKSVYLETYGCSANQSHSELMAGTLEENGFRITGDIGKADVILINTCIVKTPTENRIRDRIRSFVGKYPDKKLVIAGCATDGEYRIFKRIAPDALFLSSHKSKDIAGLLLKKTKETERRTRKNPLVGITEIASGCLGTCAYCAVKLARGNLRSRPPKEISVEVEKSIKDGCKEIWLTSQDCGCYGLDIGTNLSELIRRIVKIKGDFRIRVGMMNPIHIKPIIKGLIGVYENPKIYKFIHIPVQSGSDNVLRKMNRGYRVKDFERIVKEFRNAFPKLTLSTDIIVGFPGEAESDFRKSLDLLRRASPDIVNLSRFSPRPRTIASKMKQLDNMLIKERSKTMSELVREIGQERNKSFVNNEFSVLVNEKGKKNNQFIGRSENYKPVVLTSGKDITGRFLRVGIISAGKTYLVGQILKV
jgi:threonylcarbamoyladenosine tRNA methylthiotransferase CDKAL1